MRRINGRRMSTVSGWVIIGCFMFIASLVGCSGKPKTAHSGFLGDYSQLKPVPEWDGASVYRTAKFRKEYDKAIVDPVRVHFASNAEGTAINPDRLKELTDYFEQAVKRVLSERGRLAEAPGPGVYRLRIAITSIKMTNPMFNIHPAMKMSGIGLGGAAIEAEAVDSQTGERLAALLDSKPGSRVDPIAGVKTLGHAKQAIDRWVELYAKNLDELRAKRGE